jgi:hypothetical protein
MHGGNELLPPLGGGRSVGLWPQPGANQASIVGRKSLHDVPNGPVVEIPGGITPTGHILCAVRDRHKECSNPLGTASEIAASINSFAASQQTLCDHCVRCVSLRCEEHAICVLTMGQQREINVSTL